MSEPTSGGITVKVLTGRTAASLQRYRDSNKEGQEPYLLATTRHCAHDVELQIAEWKAVREEHGTQGARRAERASFEEVDPHTGLHPSGPRGTHVREYTGGRWRKRPVRDAEIPTHFRIDACDLAVKESEAVHTIYAAGVDLVNPDNPEDIESFFNAVRSERNLHYPGVQESLWLERNGESGFVHVHVASNATVYADFTLGDRDYVAGRKMAGELTHVHTVRARFEQYLDDHPDHGFTQSLARVGTQRYRDAQLRDGQATYWANKRGHESAQDRIRRAVGEALIVAGVTDRGAFVAEMQSRGVEVTETGLRRGIPGKNHDFAYRAADAKQAVRGKTLGADFTIAAIDAQLDRRARGLDIEPLSVKQRVGRPRPLPFEPVDGEPLSAQDQAEFDELRAAVAAMARQERATQAAEQQPVQLTFAQQALQDMRQWRDVGVADAEFERLRQAQIVSETKSPQSGPVVTVGPSASAPALTGIQAAPVPVAPIALTERRPIRSQLRNLHGRDEKAQRNLDLLIEIDEDFAERFAAGGSADEQFEQRVSQLGIGRKLIDGRLGQALHPAVRDQLERREIGKAVGTAEFELAKTADGDDHAAHLTRSARARRLVKAGDYDRAAAMSSVHAGTEVDPKLTMADLLRAIEKAKQRQAYQIQEHQRPTKDEGPSL